MSAKDPFPAQAIYGQNLILENPRGAITAKERSKGIVKIGRDAIVVKAPKANVGPFIIEHSPYRYRAPEGVLLAIIVVAIARSISNTIGGIAR